MRHPLPITFSSDTVISPFRSLLSPSLTTLSSLRKPQVVPFLAVDTALDIPNAIDSVCMCAARFDPVQRFIRASIK
jgi:hypothetical protein